MIDLLLSFDAIVILGIIVVILGLYFVYVQLIKQQQQINEIRIETMKLKNFIQLQMSDHSSAGANDARRSERDWGTEVEEVFSGQDMFIIGGVPASQQPQSAVLSELEVNNPSGAESEEGSQRGDSKSEGEPHSDDSDSETDVESKSPEAEAGKPAPKPEAGSKSVDEDKKPPLPAGGTSQSDSESQHEDPPSAAPKRTQSQTNLQERRKALSAAMEKLAALKKKKS